MAESMQIMQLPILVGVLNGSLCTVAKRQHSHTTAMYNLLYVYIMLPLAKLKGSTII